MPIEIKELHIRVTVNTGTGKAGDAAKSTPAPGAGGGSSKETILAECVEQVLQVVQNKKER